MILLVATWFSITFVEMIYKLYCVIKYQVLFFFKKVFFGFLLPPNQILTKTTSISLMQWDFEVQFP